MADFTDKREENLEGCSQSTFKKDTDVCFVCKSEAEDEKPMFTFGCKHSFHLQCLVNGFYTKGICPHCIEKEKERIQNASITKENMFSIALREFTCRVDPCFVCKIKPTNNELVKFCYYHTFHIECLGLQRYKERMCLFCRPEVIRDKIEVSLYKTIKRKVCKYFESRKTKITA